MSERDRERERQKKISSTSNLIFLQNTPFSRMNFIASDNGFRAKFTSKQIPFIQWLTECVHENWFIK